MSSVHPGEIGVFIAGDNGYIKEYRKDGLHSHNPDYARIIFNENEEVHCIGKVLGKVRIEDWSDEESYNNWLEFERKGR
jgi:SOS-response transcriptional repressor LexA